jgi:hypothetical protein
MADLIIYLNTKYTAIFNGGAILSRNDGDKIFKEASVD